MKKKSGIDPIWFTLGCLIGFTTASLLIVGLKISVNFVVLQKYQDIIGSLVGSILALGAAVPTIWIIQRQIQQTKDLDDERRKRKDYATRAVLPHMLVKTIDYAEHCVGILLDLYGHNADALDERWGAPECWDPRIPELPNEVATAIRENIEVTSNLSAREDMRFLLEKLQVQRSRFGGYLAGIKTQNASEVTGLYSWEIHIWDAIEIYALSSQLFNYARLEKELFLPLAAYMNALRINCNRVAPELSDHVEDLVIQKWNRCRDFESHYKKCAVNTPVAG